METIREDVREDDSIIILPPLKLDDQNPSKYRDGRCHYEDPCEEDQDIYPDTLGAFAVYCVVAAPFYVPRVLLRDSKEIHGFFSHFPYEYSSGNMVLEDAPGQMLAEKWTRDPRPWFCRVRFDYCDEFNDLERIGGRVLLDTTFRFGVDSETNYLRERLSSGRHDKLWLGDCNFTYRFVQSERMQWRTGLGFNWLDDHTGSDFGFNFTYGLDYFPKKPWVISATIDWGTLGAAELFRIRTTGGVVFRGVETFIGYEYLDIDRTQSGGLMAGLGFWF